MTSMLTFVDMPFRNRLDHLNTQLIESAEQCDCKRVKKLLDAKADPNARNVKNCTPLHVVALKGQAVIAVLLVKAGANIYSVVCGNRPRTAMNLAIEAGQFNMVEILFKLGYDLNRKSYAYQRRPLFDACYLGAYKIVRYLLKNGASVVLEPGVVFMATKHPKILSLVLNHGGKAIVERYSGGLGYSPLHYAAQIGNAKVVRTLIAAGANIRTRDLDNRTAWDVLKQRIFIEISRNTVTHESCEDFKQMITLLNPNDCLV